MWGACSYLKLVCSSCDKPSTGQDLYLSGVSNCCLQVCCLLLADLLGTSPCYQPSHRPTTLPGNTEMQGSESKWGREVGDASPFRGDGVGFLGLVRSFILANKADGTEWSLGYKVSLARLMMSAAELTGYAFCNKVRPSSKYLLIGSSLCNSCLLISSAFCFSFSQSVSSAP